MSTTLIEPTAWRSGAAAADAPPAAAQTAAAATGMAPEFTTAAAAAPDPEPSPAAVPAKGSRTALAIAALEASRGLLRHEMLPPAAAEGRRRRGDGSELPSWLRPWRKLRRWLRRWPAAEIATGAIHDWWRTHPLRPVADVAAAQWRNHAVPVVRRHPVLTVTAAATLGALVVTCRPWRWPLVARGIEPLPARVGHWLVAQLSSVPVQTALAALAVMAAQPSNPAAPDPDLDPATQVKPETAVDRAVARPAPSDAGSL